MKEFQYKTFAEAMPHMAFISDPEGNIFYFNQRWYDYIGQLKGTEGWGWKDKPIHHPDDLRRTLEKWESSLSTGEPYEIEYRLRRFDGQYRWHLGRAMPIRDEKGKTKLWLGTNTDIHAQKEAEEALKIEQQRLLGVIENISAGAVIISQQGHILSMNKTALQIHGFENSEEMFSQFDRFAEEFELRYPDGSIIPVDDWPFTRAVRRDYVRDLEVKLIRPAKDHERFVSYTVVAVNDDQGDPVNFVLTITDLTERNENLENLEKREKRLRIASSAAELGIFEWNMQENTGHWENDRMYEIFGRTREQGPFTLSEFMEKKLHPEDHDRFESILAGGMDNEQYFTLSGRIYRNGNEIRWVEFSGMQEIEPAGSPRLIGVIRDITDQRNLEENLKNDRELLQTIFNSIPVMLTIWDPRLDVLSFNKAFERITGWTEEDNVGKNIMELVYPDPEYRKMVGDYMYSLAPGFKDLKMVTRGGDMLETTWANIKISDGRYVGIGLDISERKAFEKQLSELSNQLQAVVDNIIDGVIMFAPDGDIIKVNHAAREIFPFLSLDPYGPGTCEFVLYDLNGERVSEEDWPNNRCLRGEHFFREEYCVKDAGEDSSRYIEFSGIPLYENEKILFAVITVYDVTERKNEQIRVQKANNALQDKNRQLEKMGQLHENLLYIIAHDLRSPITSMSLIIEVLNNAADRNQELEMITSLQNLIKRQSSIINGLVEIIHVQSPENIRARKIDLGKIVSDIIREFENTLQQCGGTVEYDFREIPAIFHVESFINSILKNLVSNAIKYRKETHPLRIQIRSSRSQDYILISIRDNGIGINLEKHRNELFKPFKRFTTSSDGTGIGLYLIRSLIEKNGGYIDIQSKPDEGTVFNCFLKEYGLQDQDPKLEAGKKSM